MAAFTSKASGNWSSGGQTTWVEVGVPGNGDTVTIIGDHQITVDVDTTVGASNGVWVDGTNAAAIARNFSVFNNRKGIVIAAGKTLKVRGDIVDYYSYTTYEAGREMLTMQAGSILEFDSSTTSPTSTAYRFRVDNVNGGSRPNNRIQFNGTSGSHCTIRSNAGGANGSLEGLNVTNGLSLVGAFIDFVDLGTSSSTALNTAHGPDTAINLTDVTLTRCGSWETTTVNAAATFSVQRVKFIDSIRSYCTDWLFTTALTTGTRFISDCIFDKQFGNTMSLQDVTIRKCIFYEDFKVGATGRWAEMSDMLHRKVLAGDTNIHGDISRIYSVIDNTLNNSHCLSAVASNGNKTLSGYIHEKIGDGSLGDGFLTPSSVPASLTTYKVDNALYPPDLFGNSSTIGITVFGGIANVNFGIQKSTFYANVNSGFDTWLLSMSETGDLSPGQILYFRSCLVYCPTAGKGFKVADNKHLADSTGLATDLGSPANLDYNAGYNVKDSYPTSPWFTNQGRGYAGKFSVTPGAHDVEVLNPGWTGPNFVDISRNLASFDRDYLGNTSVPTWTTAASYTKGQIISHANATIYAGKRVNYRCVASHTSGATTEPGAGSNWRDDWIFATFDSVASAIMAGTTYNVGSFTNLHPIRALYEWVRLGWSPQSSLLATAGHDGGVVGAVAVTTSSGGGSKTVGIGIQIGIQI